MKTIFKTVTALTLASGTIFAQQMPSNSRSMPSAPAAYKNNAGALRGSKAQTEFAGIQEAKDLRSANPSRTKGVPTFKTIESESGKAGERGGSDPGGGGSYRVNGQLKTLAEAGVIFSRTEQLAPRQDYPKYYDVKPETIEALRGILTQLPPSQLRYVESSVKSRGTFIDQTKIDEKDYSKIKSDYQKVIQTYGKKLDESAFVLAAYGKDGKTYVLPAFEEHSPFQQALILIHESFMRGKGDSKVSKLELVLNLDAAIYDVLNNGASDRAVINYYRALQKLGVVSEEQVTLAVLWQLYKKLGRPIVASELSLNPMDASMSLVDRLSGYGYFESKVRSAKLDPSLIQNFESVLPGVTRNLEKLSMILLRNERSSDRVRIWDYEQINRPPGPCDDLKKDSVKLEIADFYIVIKENEIKTELEAWGCETVQNQNKIQFFEPKEK